MSFNYTVASMWHYQKTETRYNHLIRDLRRYIIMSLPEEFPNETPSTTCEMVDLIPLVNSICRLLGEEGEQIVVL